MTEHPLTLTDDKSFSIEPIAKTGAAKWSYFSLVFSMFYFFNILASFDRFTNNQLMIALVIYISFIILFIKAIRSTGKSVLWPIIAIILLSALGTSINPGTNALFGYAAFFSGYYFLRKYAVMLLILNITAQISSALILDLFSPYFLGPSLACSLSLFVYGVFSQKEYIHVCLQEKKNQQIEQLAAIAERERIARDMHDLLGHSLSSLALKSELAEKLANKAQFDAAKKEMSEVAALARQTLSEVRFAVTGLKLKGLKGSLLKLTNELKNMKFDTQCYIYASNLPPMVESTLIMLSKEWITNILRHSKGDSVSIAVSVEANNVKLNIGDNGQIANMEAGNGIDGMRSRVNELGGTIMIKHEQGVKLEVVIPLPETFITSVKIEETVSI
jgi:two-component system sensor histidine kinase DesK